MDTPPRAVHALRAWACTIAFLFVQTACIASAWRACEDSGYCSVGLKKSWTGDIRSSAALHAMLQAVSFKKELIITSLTSEYDDQEIVQLWVDQVLQLHWELEELGFGHLVVVAQAEEACSKVHQYVPHISCVWDSTPLDLWAGSGYVNRVVWFNRWKLFARAGRLGYNLMSLDADTIVFRDPYKYIKSGPMADIQLWCNPEFGKPLKCNGGFVYIQNAQPDGPVTWVFKQFVKDQMWMMDDQYEVAQSMGGEAACYSFDQDALHDCVRSAFVGRPAPLSWVTSCASEGHTFDTPTGSALRRSQVEASLTRMIGQDVDILNVTQVPPPADWTLGLISDEAEWGSMMINRLTVPNLEYGYPKELGGSLGAAELLKTGNVSAWEAMLRADCPDCRWWPEVRPVKSPAPAPAGKQPTEGSGWQAEAFWDQSVPVETLGIGPGWLSNSMFWGYRAGMWAGRAAGLPAPFAISHVHYWPDLAREHKIQVRKALGRYNYQLAASVLPHGPYLCRHDVKRVLALHPSIDLRRTRDVGEFNAIVAGLIQVAHLTHHTPLLPDVPCGAPWLHDAAQHGSPACHPAFHQGGTRVKLPSALPYPVDQQRNLVGGWMRRLMTADQLSGVGARRRQDTAAADDVGSAQGPGGDSTGVHHQRQRMQMEQQQSEGGSSRAESQGGSAPFKSAEEQAKFWRAQSSWMFALGYLWDVTCTLHIGAPGAITTPEFVYWRSSHLTPPPTASDSADASNNRTQGDPWRGAPLHSPSPANTVLTAGDPRLIQVMQPLAGVEDKGDDWVLRPQPDLGWSVADAQVLLPASQVVHQVAVAAESSHLVYLAHPVAVVDSHTRRERGDHRVHHPSRAAANLKARALHDAESAASGLSQQSPVAHLDKELSGINKRLTESRCKVVQGSHHTRQDFHFNNTLLGVVRAGKVHLLTTGLKRPMPT